MGLQRVGHDLVTGQQTLIMAKQMNFEHARNLLSPQLLTGQSLVIIIPLLFEDKPQMW